MHLYGHMCMHVVETVLRKNLHSFLSVSECTKEVKFKGWMWKMCVVCVCWHTHKISIASQLVNNLDSYSPKGRTRAFSGILTIDLLSLHNMQAKLKFNSQLLWSIMCWCFVLKCDMSNPHISGSFHCESVCWLQIVGST